jgi:asparagine synthase (glutamine-hydrolysing)
MIVTTWWKELDRAAIERTMSAVVASYEVGVVHPFTDPGVLVAAASAHPRSGFPSRTEGMREVFGDILPGAVLSRSSKARFNGPLFGTFSRQFARSWQGEGSDGLPIDRAALKRTWATEPVDARSLPLLQGLWCRSCGTEAAS